MRLHELADVCSQPEVGPMKPLQMAPTYVAANIMMFSCEKDECERRLIVRGAFEVEASGVGEAEILGLAE